MDLTPITARLSAIVNAVSILKEIGRSPYEEFANDPIMQAAAERNLQIAIQAALDIGSRLVAAESSQTPATYKDIFLALGEMGILPEAFGQRLSQMAGFRNILVHMYLAIDPSRVYEYLQHNLDDFELFAQYISQFLTSKS